MPRVARVVFAGVPHHVTQRGNRGGRVFFADLDRRVYLKRLREYSMLHGLRILSYCLMPNHVHLVVIPEEPESLCRALRPLHMRYSQYVNRARGWRGHLWQGRYFSCPLDDHRTWAAVRYVELNPLRAGLAGRAEDYGWSSAPARCGLRRDPLLWEGFPARADARRDWSAWLADGLTDDEAASLRFCTRKGLPCGSATFVSRLERLAGRTLRPRRRGRPKRNSRAKKGSRP